ncbi:50S ribosomal protein L22 [Limisalsivibrio acetivorans]|uniref:50S ribosomal protein L22 n=1 Tax=Limisalsivibrio acetivorans TaxID=1304888 RepID=UPI0003B66DB8|nr:50S ribosomal protein L22 [Limisalsivibrio acetivorans]
MDAVARAKYVRVTPRKARPVADLVRGKNVDDALALLKFTPKKAADFIYKAIKSAAANAEENNDYRDVSKLFVKEIRIDEGPFWKRYRPRAYGRASLIRKRTSHITVVLSEEV